MRMHQVVASIVTLAFSASIASAGGDTAFTYQGRLLDADQPANGLFDFRFGLFSTAVGGVPIGAVQIDNTPVTDGLFTVQIDFGADAFDNSERWLEITVGHITLSPRQPITRAPYAIQTRGMFIGDDGNVLFHSLNEVEGTVTFSSIGGIDMILDADTNNVGEDQNARIVMTQDGGQVVGRMGYREGANQLEIMQEWNDNLVLGTNNEDRITILPDGNVGIGTTAPQFPLEVVSAGGTAIGAHDTAASGAALGVLGRSDSTSGWGVLGWATANSGVTNGVFGQSNSDSGRGVFGWASADSGVTDGVRGESDSNSGRGVVGRATAATGSTTGVRGESNSTSGFGVHGRATATSGTNYAVLGQSDSTSGFDFFATGAGTDYGSSSSIRWKSNVRNIDQPLAKVARLRGVYFNWDADHGGHHDLGMIAEEVGEVLPEIVNYEENGIDANGMDYSKLTPLLVEAIKELHGEVEHKDSQITELQARLTALEALVEQLALQQDGGTP